MTSGSLMALENDQMVKNLLQQGEDYKAAELCFLLETTKDLKVKVIEKFVREKKISIKGEKLSKLGNKTLKALLLYCQETKNGNCPKIIVSKASKSQKMIWHYF
ncbi:MAG: hypothetical protein WC410_02680 [Candidatus Paceibacterota bacterium]|jgi:hypothetical protein|nr:hypothetical protein [Candidatus Paceibacterota bacterium]MDD5555521.1 hypothetical protein [Candidatus Paceibacterota bacterium]